MGHFGNNIRALLIASLLVTFSVAQAQEVWPSSPRDLPYYDIEWAKNLTLQDLNVSIVSRDMKDGLDIVAVEFNAFDQPIAGPEGLVTVRWRQRAVLVLPPSPLPHAKALAFSIHDAEAGSKDNPRSFLGMSISVARAFRIPVLVHSWMPDVVNEVEGVIFHSTQDKVMRRLLEARIEDAEDLPMDGRYLFNGSPLVKSDMVALTLLQRLIEQERGMTITEIASMGGSKEGHSHWVLGAIDDRITVLAPGGLYWHDTAEMLDRYGKDWAWRFPWKGGDGPQYNGLRDLFETLWKFGDWIISTEAGQMVARTTIDTSTWYDEIQAKHVVVFGDLGITPGQHDGPWPFWAENKPLSTFRHPSWRYLRLFDGSGAFMDEQGVGEMGLSLLPQLADLLVNDAISPSTPKVELQPVGDRLVRVSVNATMATDLEHEVLALYAISPERGLRDREYWQIENLRQVQDRQWEVTLPAVPEGHGVTVITVVRERVVVGDYRYWRSASSLPVEHFAVQEFNVAGPSWRD